MGGLAWCHFFIVRLLLEVEANIESVTLLAGRKMVTPGQVLRQSVRVETDSSSAVEPTGSQQARRWMSPKPIL